MKTNFKFTLVGCCLLHIAVLASSTLTRASYGETCNSFRRCAKREWLACNERGVCGCLKPDVMTFESGNGPSAAPVIEAAVGSGKCATKVGERCRFSLGGDDDGGSMFDTFPCVQNSKCDSEGFCVCKEEFYETTNGTCTRFQSYMQPCNDELKCLSDFQCIDKLCICEATSSLYDFRLGQCVGLAGGPCLKQSCVENAACVGGSCKCNDGYFQIKQGSCSLQAAYGSRCTQDEHCVREKYSKSQLRCTEGKCECDTKFVYGKVGRSNAHNNPKHYNSNFHGFDGNFREMCAPKVNNTCIEGFCAPNSYCVYNKYHGDYSSGICDCVPGTAFSKSSGLCGRQYGSTCTSRNECADGLKCVTGKCNCSWDQTYEPYAKICESKVNAPCTSEDHCEEYSECKKDTVSGNRRCTCKAGYIIDGANGCKGTWNTSCSYGTEECDSLGGLQCVEQRCSCPSSSIYSFHHQKCVGLVGARCNETEDCTAHALCVFPRRPAKGRTDVTGFCTCNKEFTETEIYTCEPNEELNPIQLSVPTGTELTLEETGSIGAQAEVEESTQG